MDMTFESVVVDGKERKATASLVDLAQFVSNGGRQEEYFAKTLKKLVKQDTVDLYRILLDGDSDPYEWLAFCKGMCIAQFCFCESTTANSAREALEMLFDIDGKGRNAEWF